MTPLLLIHVAEDKLVESPPFQGGTKRVRIPSAILKIFNMSNKIRNLQRQIQEEQSKIHSINNRIEDLESDLHVEKRNIFYSESKKGDVCY